MWGMREIEAAIGCLLDLKTLDMNMACDVTPNPPPLDWQGIATLRKLTYLKWDGCWSPETLGKQLSSLKNVTELEFRYGSPIPSLSAARDLAAGLRGMTGLTRLKLDMTRMESGGEAFTQALGASLKHLHGLQLLDLDITDFGMDDGGIGAVGASALGSGLASLSQLRSLSIHLPFNDIGDMGARDLGKALQHLQNLILRWASRGLLASKGASIHGKSFLKWLLCALLPYLTVKGFNMKVGEIKRIGVYPFQILLVFSASSTILGYTLKGILALVV